MEPQEAVGVLSLLVDGIDPLTGEEFPADGPYQNPQVLRALFCAIRALEQSKRTDAKGRALPTGAGTPWTAAEESELLRRFDADVPIKEIARTHQRTTGAIRSRLIKLGRIQLEDVVHTPTQSGDAAPSRRTMEIASPEDVPF